MAIPVAGLRALRRIQLVVESTPGNAVTTATARLIGTMGMKQTQKYYRPSNLETGKLSDYERTAIIGVMAELPFESDANYEQLGYLLNMAVMSGITGSGPTDSQYVWTYKPNLTALNSPTTYTIQYGDDLQAFLSAFCFATDLEISGSIDEAVKVKASLVGDYVRTGTFTSLSNPTALNPVVVGTGKLYIDSSWATLGNTEKLAGFVDFSYKITAESGTGITPVKYANGSIYYTDRAEKKRHIELNATLAFNANAVTLWTAYTAQTPIFIRLKFTGPLIGATAHDELDLDGCFVIDEYSELQDREGQDIVKLKLLSQYDITGTSEWQIILKNALSVLP